MTDANEPKAPQYIEASGEYGVTVEVYPDGDSFDVYCAGSYVGSIFPEEMFAVADNDKIVIPDSIVD